MPLFISILKKCITSLIFFSVFSSHVGIRASTNMQRKLALVIGNRVYERNATLTNPEHDANDMTSSLEAVGFRVSKGLNLKSDEMDSHINNFIQQIQPSDLVLFYFSGHGTQWEVR
jgi:uncharacterized caspase-like protein